MQPAVIDVLYRAVVFNHQEAWQQLDERAAECAAMRSLISTDQPGGIDLGLGLGVDGNEFIIPLIQGPRAFFVSAKTAVQGLLQAGRSEILLDYSLSFDSNFAERLKRLINQTTASADQDLARVKTILMLKANNPRVQFDILPFLYENVRLSRDDTSNERPIDTLVAFRTLDYLDWDRFRKTEELHFNGESIHALKGRLRPAAERLIYGLHANEEFLRHEASVLATEALLLRLAGLWHAPNRDVKAIFGQLIDYCVNDLGFIPMTDLSLIWKGIATKQAARFFGPITGRSHTIFEKIKGMAWDLSHLRLLERMAAQNSYGAFHIPFFVSLDAKWRELLRLNPIRFMLFDDHTRRMLSGRADEERFQEICLSSVSESTKRLLSHEQVAKRRAAASSLSIEAMHTLVRKEQERWL
ncbi:hypothetical protein [Pseudomonas donghuensis]|uniref:Uncharacterized protein n=1 Tax=Pseudomonas donghuensis TaxID=1163398 RepID=A0AAP0SCZ1_9PSED|nr:hypothetical protein [Pseudomonas donghuensis]KDN97017.2 hypothetical protein BV82_5226 [Pseudomonas donghuensis]